MQVIALDKKHQCGTEGFSKPCGGLLAPDAQRSFIRDGLTLPVDVIANPQIFSVKTVDVAASLTRNYQRSYININRHAFDLWMKSLIPTSVEVYHDSLCRKIWREDDKWHVIFVQTAGSSILPPAIWEPCRIRKKSYAKVFRASVRAETSRLPVCGSAARRNRQLG